MIVCVQLRDAPASHAKRGMMTLAFLVPVWLICFIVTMVVLGSSSRSYYTNYYYNSYDYEQRWEQPFQIASGVMLTIYGLLCGGFVACADITYRSTIGPVTSDLSDPVYLRGVNLGVNLAGLFMFPWAPFALVGIPLVLRQLKKKRTEASGYGASLGLGITSLVLLVAIILTLIIAGSMRSQYWSDYDDFKYSYRACRKREVLQDATTGELTTMATTTAELATTTVELATTATFELATTATFELATTAFDAFPSWATTPWATTTADWAFSTGWGTAASTVPICHAFKNPNYGGPFRTALNDWGAAVALGVLCPLWFFVYTAFIAVADAMILKLIAPKPAAAMPGGQQITAACVQCAAPLQFVRTGPTTQVQCYQCKAICEFQIA